MAAPGVSTAAPNLRSERHTVTLGVLGPLGSRQARTSHLGAASAMAASLTLTHRAGGRVSLVLDTKELDDSRRVVRAVHPAADPARVGQDGVGLRFTRTDNLVAKLAGERQIRKPIAVYVAH